MTRSNPSFESSDEGFEARLSLNTSSNPGQYVRNVRPDGG